MTISDRFDFALKHTVRILVVTDGAINIWDVPPEPANMDNTGFTLREMARALWDAPESEYPYTRFAFDHAIHGTGSPQSRPRVEVDPETGKSRTWTELSAFKFDQAGFRLDRYQQVWFFGFWPGNPIRSGLYGTPANRVPLSPNELRVLLVWMKAGGGVFATGDHGLLGSHLCGGIPRVGAMRRWADLGLSHNVPSAAGVDRVDTIVPVRQLNGQPDVRFDDQSDNTPKPLRLRRHTLWEGPFHLPQPAWQSQLDTTRWAPHPVLCSPLGPIDILPDHMHEGMLNEDDEVALDGLDTDGAPEFPGGATRPRPEVIAWATVRGGHVTYHDFGTTEVVHRVVPTVSVYDGQRVNIGRVVVDATWHNWLDVNVRGTGAGGGAAGLQGKNLELVHHYVRNIAQWLATAEQRQWMRDGLFVHVVTHTGGWSELVGITRYLGEQASNVLGQVAAECTRSSLVFDPWIFEDHVVSTLKSHLGKLTLPTKQAVLHGVLGAMVEAVFELVPSLPLTAPDEPQPSDADTDTAFHLLSTKLGAARRRGVRALTAEWRESLRNSAALMDAIDHAVSEPVCQR